MTSEELKKIQTRFARLLVLLQGKPAPSSQQEMDKILDGIYRDYRKNRPQPEEMLFAPRNLQDHNRPILKNELDAAGHPLRTILGPNRYEMVRELMVVSGFPRKKLGDKQAIASWARRLISDFNEEWADQLAQNGRSTSDLLSATTAIWPDPDPLGKYEAIEDEPTEVDAPQNKATKIFLSEDQFVAVKLKHPPRSFDNSAIPGIVREVQEIGFRMTLFSFYGDGTPVETGVDYIVPWDSVEWIHAYTDTVSYDLDLFLSDVVADLKPKHQVLYRARMRAVDLRKSQDLS